MFKRIVAVFSTLVICFSIFFPCFAAVGSPFTPVGFWGGGNSHGSGAGRDGLYKVISSFLPVGKTPENATESDWKNAYNQYNTTINTTYGTTSFPSDKLNGYINIGGFRVYPLENPFADEEAGLFAGFDSYHSYNVWRNGTAAGWWFPSNDLGAIAPAAYPYDAFQVKNGSLVFVDAAFSDLGIASHFSNTAAGLQDAFKSCVLDTVFFCYYSGVSGTPFSVYSVQRFYFPVLKITSYSYRLVTKLFSIPNANTYPISGPYNYRVYPHYSNLNIDTRTGSLAGNFGYYGDNGQLIAAENMTIVNETNNTYTNPQTGTTSPVTNWTYDYSDRSYHLTLESGDTVNVTYGDENVTIKEGDTVYNIYYLTTGGGETPDPGPSPSPSPSPDPGPSPSPGPGGGDGNNSNNHDNQGSWFGNIVISIGDIFNNVLGGGSGSGEDNPDSGGGGIISGLFGKIGELIGAFVNGILKLIETAIMKLLDGVIAIINMLSEKLGQVLESLFAIFDNVPKMFDGFTLFLTHCFAFLPPEIITFLTFGVLAMVLIAIFRFFLGK